MSIVPHIIQVLSPTIKQVSVNLALVLAALLVVLALVLVLAVLLVLVLFRMLVFVGVVKTEKTVSLFT